MQLWDGFLYPNLRNIFDQWLSKKVKNKDSLYRELIILTLNQVNECWLILGVLFQLSSHEFDFYCPIISKFLIIFFMVNYPKDLPDWDRHHKMILTQGPKVCSDQGSNPEPQWATLTPVLFTFTLQISSPDNDLSSPRMKNL